MTDKKAQEQHCLDTTKDYVSNRLSKKVRSYFYSLCPINLNCIQNERPDFVINHKDCSYAIEHFLVDFCFDGPNNNQSNSKRATKDLNAIYNKYHDPENGTIKDEDVEAARSELQKLVNTTTNLTQKYDYNNFLDAFIRVFNAHHDRVAAYRNNSAILGREVKVGFLIELHFVSALLCAKLNGSNVYFSNREKFFPMTKEILALLTSATDLDFVIISQYHEGVPLDAKDVKIYEPQNISKSLDIQRIKVFDEVSYLDIERNIVLKVN